MSMIIQSNCVNIINNAIVSHFALWSFMNRRVCLRQETHGAQALTPWLVTIQSAAQLWRLHEYELERVSSNQTSRLEVTAALSGMDTAR